MGGRNAGSTGRGRRRTARRSRTAVLCLAAAVLSGCTLADERGAKPYPPRIGSADVGSLAVRWTHVETPPADGWQRGDDAGLHLWAVNEGDGADVLVGGQSAVAQRTVVVDADGVPLSDGVPLRPHRPRRLYADQPHLELRDLRRPLRRGEFLTVTLTFRRAGSVTLQIQVLNRTWDEEEPTPTETASPSVPSPSGNP